MGLGGMWRGLCGLAATLAMGPAVVGAAGLIGISRQGTDLVLSWDAESGHRYRLETSATPAGPWQAARVAEAAGAGPMGWTATNALATAGTGFFRLADLGVVAAGPTNVDSAARVSDLVPIELADLYTRSAQDAYDAIQAATALGPAGNGPVTHGTLTLTGNAGAPVRYDPVPADRLVLVPLQGSRVEVYVQQLDLARNLYQWRQVSGASDLVFRSEPELQGTRATVRGRYVSASFPGWPFEVDLSALASGFSEVDSSGTHTLSDVTVTGSITAAGYQQTVQARNRFEFISVRGVTGRLESASTSEQWNGNTVVFGGDTYRWVNAKRQRSFRDGKESEVDTYWNASGEITRNGQPFGRYRKTLTPVGSSVIDLRFQVVLPDRVVDVEQWTIQAPGAGR